MSREFDREFEDTEGNLLRVYTTVDEQDVNQSQHVRIISDALVKELVFNRTAAIRFINTMLDALGAGTQIKVQP